MATCCSMRRARAPGRVALSIRYSTAKRFRLLRIANMAFALGAEVSAESRSAGTSMVAWTAYAMSQRPSAYAVATWLVAAGCIRPCVIRRDTMPTLRADHWLRARRGVKRVNGRHR